MIIISPQYHFICYNIAPADIYCIENLLNYSPCPSPLPALVTSLVLIAGEGPTLGWTM